MQRQGPASSIECAAVQVGDDHAGPESHAEPEYLEQGQGLPKPEHHRGARTGKRSRHQGDGEAGSCEIAVKLNGIALLLRMGRQADVEQAVRSLPHQPHHEQQLKRRRTRASQVVGDGSWDIFGVRDLLNAALSAQSRGVTVPALDAYLEPAAWRALIEAVKDAASNDTAWSRTMSDRVLPLADLLWRARDATGGKGLPVIVPPPAGGPQVRGDPAMAAMAAMHDAVFLRLATLAAHTPDGVVEPDVYARDFKVILLAASRVHNLAPSVEDMRTKACALLLSMADAIMQGVRGVCQEKFPEDSPDIPLTVCLEDIAAIVPTREDADVFLVIDRNDLLATSFEAVMGVTKQAWCTCEFLDVSFEGESGYGDGVVREWLTSLAAELFLNTMFFAPCPHAPRVAHPVVRDDCLKSDDMAWLNFAGRIMALAVKFGIPLGVHVTAAMLKTMTLKSVTLADLDEVDPEMARTLRNINAMTTPEEVSAMGLDGFRAPDGSELFVGSGLVEVTLANRDKFTEMVAQHVIFLTAQACTGILNGFLHVVDADLMRSAFVTLSRTPPAELNALIGGDVFGDISAADLRAHTTVQIVRTEPPAQKHDDVVDAFFEIVAEMSPDERRALLCFWTGLRCLPAPGGFSRLSGLLRLVVYPTAPAGRLPTVQTCVMSMDMPCGGGKSVMRDKLVTAMQWAQGFEDGDEE